MNDKPDSIRLNTEKDSTLREDLILFGSQKDWSLQQMVRKACRYWLTKALNEEKIIKLKNRKK